MTCPVSNDRSGSRRLADDIELGLIYSDATRFGGLPSRRLIGEIRRRCEPILRHWHLSGGSATVAQSQALIDAALQGALGELYLSPGVLHPELLYPAPSAIVPAALSVSRDGRELTRIELLPELTSQLARWIGDWAREARAPRAGAALELHRALDAVGAFTSEPPPAALAATSGHFVGHATVCVGNAQRGRILVDPYLLPTSSRLPGGYRPIVASQLDHLGAVCVTHCHPDHFCLGSLLKLGADTLILVPRVERESALSIAMRARLSELGFTRVEELAWGESRALPAGRVTALPFYGEQPTTSRRLHPELRNEGNSYLLELDGKQYLTVADSGKDDQGEAIEVAERLRAKVGRLDVLFGGYRSFPLYPVEYLPSSVPQYLLFTAREDWGRRQKIMYDAEELLDLAECWGARHLVPYACGGAPWYWQRGLGPVLDSATPTSRCDPVPEVVQAAAAFRTGTESEPHASPIQVAILRPGDGWQLTPEGLEVVRQEPHAWPFERRAAAQSAQAPAGEPRFLQWNVSLADPATPAGQERVWLLLRRIVPLVQELKELQRCTGFFFQCKEPGLRLRLELPHGAADPSGDLRLELERARAIGAIDAYAPGVYEPEWRVFGGKQAMTVVHRYFDADTSLCIDRLALERCTMPQRVLETEQWLALVVNDLVGRCLLESSECWDVYSSLLERHAELEVQASLEPVPEQLEFESLGEQELFRRYCARHVELASSLRELAHSGLLEAGRRSVVAQVVQFQFNRYLLSAAAQQAILLRLQALRDPARSSAAAALRRPRG